MTAMDLTSLTPLTLGFIPLMDSAPLMVAVEKGFARDEGLALRLARETSWSNIRDRVVLGHFDGAHMLGPMTIAAGMGLGTLKAEMIAPFVLNRGGNAIAVSTNLGAEMDAAGFSGDIADAAGAGHAMARVVAARAAAGRPPLTFAVVYPFSPQSYEIRHWLAASGIDPDQDVQLVVVPPPFMVDALTTGSVDGFCVGAPWPSLAVMAGIGRIVATKAAIWPRAPEKVLGVTARWAERHGEDLARLIRASDAACRWIAEPSHHDELAAILARPDYVGVPVELLRRVLADRLILTPGGPDIDAPGYMDFYGDGTNRPRVADALWYAHAMRRWGQCPADAMIDTGRAARRAFDARAYDVALGREPAPEDLTPFALFDGVLFDPAAAG
jgi:NitT/TauT family transport system ATP-binding protein